MMSYKLITRLSYYRYVRFKRKIYDVNDHKQVYKAKILIVGNIFFQANTTVILALIEFLLFFILLLQTECWMYNPDCFVTVVYNWELTEHCDNYVIHDYLSLSNIDKAFLLSLLCLSPVLKYILVSLDVVRSPLALRV